MLRGTKHKKTSKAPQAMLTTTIEISVSQCTRVAGSNLTGAEKANIKTIKCYLIKDKSKKSKQDILTLENEVGKAMHAIKARKLAQDELIKATKQKVDSHRGERWFDGGNLEYLNAMLESIIKVREKKKTRSR
jgi:hypothetical protein